MRSVHSIVGRYWERFSRSSYKNNFFWKICIIIWVWFKWDLNTKKEPENYSNHWINLLCNKSLVWISKWLHHLVFMNTASCNINTYLFVFQKMLLMLTISTRIWWYSLDLCYWASGTKCSTLLIRVDHRFDNYDFMITSKPVILGFLNLNMQPIRRFSFNFKNSWFDYNHHHKIDKTNMTSKFFKKTYLIENT